MGKSVLLIAPQTKPREELEKRIKSLYGIEVNSDPRLSSIITSGLMNRKDLKDPTQLQVFEQKLAAVDVVLVDEVEYTMNDSGFFLYERLGNAEMMYAFSGTADKRKGEMITFANGLSEGVIRNKDIIKYFGPSLIYRMPLDLKVDYIRVKTSALGRIKFEPSDFGEGTNVYNNVICKIFTDPDVCRLVVKIAKRYPKIYLPMYNLTSVISEWLNYFIAEHLRILLICGEGFIYYNENGEKHKLKDLSEACQYVASGQVDVIPSTSAGFRALDLPGLETTLLTIGKMAGVVLQSVGRTARGSHMNLITLEPWPKKKIPVYSSGMKERDEMILQYYKYCDITESEIHERNL